MLSKKAALRKDEIIANYGYAELQHRHFATIAAILRKLNADVETCERWADELRFTNPNFNRARFLRACQED